jgi:hypothetical protein
MAEPRVLQVLREQVLIRPERYTGYHRDLLEVLNSAMKAVSDGDNGSKRQKELANEVRAKASRLPVSGETV